MDLKHALLAIERRLWTNDPAIYGANLTYDAVLVFAETGVIGRETALAAIRQENAEGRRWTEAAFNDVFASQVTPDTALLTYRVTARWEHEQSPITAVDRNIIASAARALESHVAKSVTPARPRPRQTRSDPNRTTRTAITRIVDHQRMGHR